MRFSLQHLLVLVLLVVLVAAFSLNGAFDSRLRPVMIALSAVGFVSGFVFLLRSRQLASSFQSVQVDTSSLNLEPPSPTINTMYTEITNISQGINIGLFVFVVTDQSFRDSIATSLYSTPVFAVTSLVMTLIFWTRFYFDTDILKRSYSVLSTLLFFLFAISMGANILFLKSPRDWLFSASAVLFIGVAFYSYNLNEIRRKLDGGVALELSPIYISWQKKRMVDLIFLACLSGMAGVLIQPYPVLSLPLALISISGAFWQLLITGEYRTYRFLRTGL